MFFIDYKYKLRVIRECEKFLFDRSRRKKRFG